MCCFFLEDVAISVAAIKGIERGVSQWTVSMSVRKILDAKFRFGLTQPVSISTNNLQSDLINSEAKTINQKLIEQALTLVKNKDNTIPIENIQCKIATLVVGSTERYLFNIRLMLIVRLSTMSMVDRDSDLLNDLSHANIVIVGMVGMNNSFKDNYKINSQATKLINQLSTKTKVVLVSYGNPYALSNFVAPDAVLCAYNDDSITQSLAIQAVFGGLPISGKLPVTALPYPFESGIDQPMVIRLSFGEPESVGFKF